MRHLTSLVLLVLLVGCGDAVVPQTDAAARSQNEPTPEVNRLCDAAEELRAASLESLAWVLGPDDDLADGARMQRLFGNALRGVADALADEPASGAMFEQIAAENERIAARMEAGVSDGLVSQIDDRVHQAAQRLIEERCAFSYVPTAEDVEALMS